MTDMDRFTAWLRREGVSYNEPAATPADTMWQGVEGRLGAIGTGPEADVGGGVAGDGGTMKEALAYNASPPVPREEMWTRIEAAWTFRRSAVAAVGGAGRARIRPGWLRRRGAAGWVAALAAAASLVVGIALGRGARPGPPGETPPPSAASASGQSTGPVEVPMAVAGRESEEADNAAGPVRGTGLAGLVTAGDEVETPELLASDPQPEPPSTLHATVTHESEDAAALPPGQGLPRLPPGRALHAGLRLEPEFDHATARHLGQAATLLTAFGTDRRTPASQADLARWARELLVETRMYLGLSSDSGSPVERTLLEDLELVLIQIAGLGPGAPDFEWELASESIERRGTLVRLRAASAQGET